MIPHAFSSRDEQLLTGIAVGGSKMRRRGASVHKDRTNFRATQAVSRRCGRSASAQTLPRPSPLYRISNPTSAIAPSRFEIVYVQVMVVASFKAEISIGIEPR